MHHFVESGFWWVPTQRKKRAAGVLKCDAEEGNSLEITIDTASPAIAIRETTIPVILGTSSSGSKITLLDCSFTRSSGSPSAATVEYYTVLVVVKGVHLAGLASFKTMRATCSFRYLEDWYGRSGLCMDYFKNGSVHIKYKQPKRLNTTLPDGTGISIFNAIECHSSADNIYSAEIQVIPRVSFSTSEPKPLGYFDHIIRVFQDFLSLAVLRFPSVTDYEITLAAEQNGEAGETAIVYQKQPYERNPSETKPRPIEMLFTAADIESKLHAILGNWYEKAERLKPVRTLFVASSVNRGFLESTFLALCAALEVFHRRFRGDGYLAQSDFSNVVLPCLLECLPRSLDSSFREALKMKLKFANQFSLRRRILDLCREHQHALDAIGFKWKRVPKQISDQRNRLTHYSEDVSEESRKAFYGSVIKSTLQLRMLIRLALLKELGFDEDEISEIAKRTERYSPYPI